MKQLVVILAFGIGLLIGLWTPLVMGWDADSIRFDNTGCTYWEVVRPDAGSGVTWVTGWMKQCGDDWSPLVEFGPTEEDAEIVLRLEKTLGLSGYKGEEE